MVDKCVIEYSSLVIISESEWLIKDTAPSNRRICEGHYP